MDDVCNENGGPWGHDQEVTRYSAVLIKAQRSQFHFHDTIHTHTHTICDPISPGHIFQQRKDRADRKKLHKMNNHIITGADFDMHTYMKINKFIYI